MKSIIIALLILAASSASAQVEVYSPDKSVARSSGTIRVVQVSSQTFTLIETSTNVPTANSAFVLLPGSDYILLQSTGTTGFCCGYEVDSSTSITVGAKGCVQAKKESGGGFYELEMRRWWQNLRLYCLSNSLSSHSILRVLQTK